MNYFVNENNKRAVQDAEQFESNSVYARIMCGQRLGKGVKETSFYEALSRLEPYQITPQEKTHYETFYADHSTPRCWLPRNHLERCSNRPETYFDSLFRNKLADCITAPGADDVVYKNRCARYFPIQIDAASERRLRADFDLKQTVKLKAAVPLEQATTAYLSATASLDIAALILGQKEAPKCELSDETLKSLRNHYKYLVDHYKQIGIRISSSNGQLSDPWTLEPFELQWWKPVSAGKDPRQIQFGHVEPINPERYMTRGLNVIPMLRTTNIMQGDRSFPEFVSETVRIARFHL